MITSEYEAELGQRLPAGQSDHAFAYVVDRLPPGHRARVESANLHGASWPVHHYMDRYGWRIMGEYQSTDAALVGLQAHLEDLD